MTSSANWFASGGETYARFRPEYPRALLDYLLSITPDQHHALMLDAARAS